MKTVFKYWTISHLVFAHYSYLKKTSNSMIFNFQCFNIPENTAEQDIIMLMLTNKTVKYYKANTFIQEETLTAPLI